MPRVPTVFFLSIYGLTAIAGLMLAFAEGNPFPEILTPALAIVAYVLTDRTRKVHLPLMWANILGVLVFLYAASQMFGTTVEVRLLAGSTSSSISPGSCSSRRSTSRNIGGCGALRAAGGDRLDPHDFQLVRRHAARLHVRFDLDLVRLFALPGPICNTARRASRSPPPAPA